MSASVDSITNKNHERLDKHTWMLDAELPLPTPNLVVPPATPTKHTVWILSSSSTAGVAVLDSPDSGDFRMLKNPPASADGGGPLSELFVEFSDIVGNKPTYFVSVVVEENLIEVGRFVGEVSPFGGGVDNFVARINIPSPLPPVPASGKIIYFLEFDHGGLGVRTLIFDPAKYYTARISATGYM